MERKDRWKGRLIRLNRREGKEGKDCMGKYIGKKRNKGENRRILERREIKVQR